MDDLCSLHSCGILIDGRKFGNIPAAAKSLDKQNTRSHTAGQQADRCALICEDGALRSYRGEVGVQSALVPVGGLFLRAIPGGFWSTPGGRPGEMFEERGARGAAYRVTEEPVPRRKPAPECSN